MSKIINGSIKAIDLVKKEEDKSNTNFSVLDLKLKPWYQGCLIEFGIKDHESKRYIILNQTCDLLYHSLEDEPVVELLEVENLGQGISKSDLDLQTGKSTRTIVIRCKDNCFYRVPSIIHRVLLPRHELIALSPLTHVDDLRAFSSWIGRRYDRVAYPDVFCELFPNARKNNAEKAYKNFVKFVKKYDSTISEVWVNLDNWNEISSSEKYTMSIVLIVNQSNIEHKELIREEFETLIEGVERPKKSDGVVAKEGIRGCLERIEIADYHILEMNEFTREDMEYYSLFNLDYISHASGEMLAKFR